MAMTHQVKAELATVAVTKPACRRAEVAATLRFAGGLHLAGGRIVVRPNSTPARRPGGSARRSPTCSGSPPSSWW